MDSPRETVEFQRIMDNSLEDFIQYSRSFGEPLSALANLVRTAFEVQLEFINIGICRPAPDDSQFNQMIEPLSIIIREVQEFRERNRHVADFFNHLSTISESIVALSWISVKPAPTQFLRDMRDAGQYFGNRVLSGHKGDSRHTNWINKWNQVLRDLEQYVKDFHLTGFSWGCAKKGANGMPPVPPPPPPPIPPMASPPLIGQMHPFGQEDFLPGGNNRHALLNELNQGLDIVRMLRPTERLAGELGGGDGLRIRPPEAVATPAPQARVMPSARNVQVPKFTLDGRKWRVEHHKNNYGLVVDNDDMSQTLAMFKCDETGLEVRNKMNGVFIDNCKRSTVVLNDIISSVEVMRSDRVKIQCNGHVPLISIDNSDSIQIFITSNSRDVEVISSKSTSCNICLLESDGDYVELPMPEQIKTVLIDKQLKSTVIEKH